MAEQTGTRKFRILAINPGSTSTKYSYYEGEDHVYTAEISHPQECLLGFHKITDQFAFRRECILNDIAEKGRFKLADLDAVVGRGGLVKPLASGTYRLGPALLEDLRKGVQGDHASNLGGLIAHDIALPLNLPCFIVDPPVVCEADDMALLTGVKEIRRKVISHALSQLSTAKRYAREAGARYRDLNLIVAHLGGGISIGAHWKGRYIDVNNALDGEGPFSPERSGTLPAGTLIDLCFSGKYTHKEMRLLNRGKGGLMSLLGTADFREVEKRIAAGDAAAEQAARAMAYQIAKSISALLPAFRGEKADRVLLTGGLAKSGTLMGWIKESLAAFPAGVTVYPGQNEMEALAGGCLRALNGAEEVKDYES